MKHLTKIFLMLAIIVFFIGVFFQYQGEEPSAIKLFLASIMFMICAFISRHNDRKRER
ncbi:SE1626 family protein [Staphylococcus hyicus]|uniref:SE1626 family protein n=1 Tax=Staphylococcus hyicus TaxID=1284 RepID=A0ACD5FRY1_STAHY